MNTRKLTLTALFVAIGIVFPQVIHMFGGPGLGSVLLPMHIPVFIGAMLLGPFYGMIIAIASVITGMLLGMPPLFIGIYMLFELSSYAVVSGFFYKIQNFNVYLSFILGKIAGLIDMMIVILIMIHFFDVSFPPSFGTLGMLIPGIPGIAIQLLIVPPLVLLLRKELKKIEDNQVY